MSHSVSLENSLFAAVSCEVVPYQGEAVSDASREPKQAFADTPPLAKLREEMRSDKAHSADDDEAGEQAIACESDHPHQPTPGASHDTGAASEPSSTSGEGACVQPATVAAALPGETATTATLQVSSDVDASPLVTTEQAPVTSGADVAATVLETTASVSESGGQPQDPFNKELRASLAVGGGSPAPAESSAVDATQATMIEGEATGQVLPSGAGTSSTPGADVVRDGVADAVSDPQSEAVPVVPSADAAMATQESAGIRAEAASTPESQLAQAASSGKQTALGEETVSPAANASLPAGRSTDEPRADGDQSVPAPGTDSLANAAEAVAAGDQGRGGGFSDASEAANEQPQVLVSSQDNATTSFAQRLEGQQVNTSSAESATSKSPVQDVGEQILSSVQASMIRGGRQMLVRLDPPELGNVLVRFQEREGQLGGVLEVSRADTRQEVERALPQVLRSLQEAGVQIKRVDVVVTDQSERDLGKDQLQQEAWAHQDHSNHREPHPERSFGAAWLGQPTDHTATIDSHSADASSDYVGRGRIDMLV